MKKLFRMLMMMLVLTMGTGLTSCDVIVNVDNPVDPKEPTGDNRTPEQVATATKLMADAFEDGALVGFKFTYEGVEYEVEFKKVGDEYVLQNPAPAPARALTRSSITNNMDALLQQIQGGKGKRALRLTVMDMGGMPILQNTIDENGDLVCSYMFTEGMMTFFSVNGNAVPYYEDKQQHGIEIINITKAKIEYDNEVIYRYNTAKMTFKLLPANATFNEKEFPGDLVFETSDPEVFQFYDSETKSKSKTLSCKPAQEITFEIATHKCGKATISVTGLPDDIEYKPFEVVVAINYHDIYSPYTVTDGDILAGSGDQPITIPDGCTVTLRDAKLDIKKTDVPAITCEGSATIILEGVNHAELPEKSNQSAIFYSGSASSGKPQTLTIKGSGMLFATGATGIDVQNLVVEGGKVSAEGRVKSAISVWDKLTVTGGSVEAQGGKVYYINGEMYLENEARPDGDASVEECPAISGSIVLGDGYKLYESGNYSPAEDQTRVTQRFAWIR